LSFHDSCIWPWRKNEFEGRARHYLMAVYETDMSSMGVDAASIKRMKTMEEAADHQLLDQVTLRMAKIPVEVEENLLFDGRDILAASRKRKLVVEEEVEAKLKKQKIKEDLKCGRVPTKKWKCINIQKRTCCGINCDVSWRGSKEWRVCKCGKLYICPNCRKKADLALDIISLANKCFFEFYFLFSNFIFPTHSIR